MTPDNARKTLLNTDYPLDKVILLKPQAITMGAGLDFNIAHGLPFVPLVWFQWSFTPDFAVAYEDNTGSFPSGNPGFYFRLQVSIEANATNIVLRGNGTLGATIIYVRIFAFQPSTFNLDLPFTDTQGDNFVMNTDYNYMKLVAKSRTALIAGGATLTIPHNLGIYPHILIWIESTAGTIYPVSLSWPTFNLNAEITRTDLILRNDSFSGSYVHYRMYLDD